MKLYFILDTWAKSIYISIIQKKTESVKQKIKTSQILIKHINETHIVNEHILGYTVGMSTCKKIIMV